VDGWTRAPALRRGSPRAPPSGFVALGEQGARGQTSGQRQAVGWAGRSRGDGARDRGLDPGSLCTGTRPGALGLPTIPADGQPARSGALAAGWLARPIAGGAVRREVGLAEEVSAPAWRARTGGPPGPISGHPGRAGARLTAATGGEPVAASG
jgi:hypothetical protein